ncbi:MAG: beta-ketoacyl synthase, partial [Streptomyces sp.]|nr:beta-ketoacyl synthase [Streptomyces sp.]
QCAAAVGWLGTAEGRADAGDALVTSGDDTTDAVAALLLSPPGRPAAPLQPGGAAA